MARAAVLFLDTNILLDLPRPADYWLPGRETTLVVIPEVMRELRGLTLARGRGDTRNAMLACATLESLARQRGSAAGIAVGRRGTTLRILPGAPVEGSSADRQLVLRARAWQTSHPGTLVTVVTRDWGVADVARAERVKSILIRGLVTPGELERGIAEHDSVLDIDL